ncbi:MAG TPA: metalloregulator ArsR/SmtB family transcription factor [Acidimicrobiales bacterium]|nr:metalloregulator ArsR/SmtB family transcription factor [Acidimicrobiales bacterium]
MVISSTATDVQTAAKLFRSLGDQTRLAILLALFDGERRVTDLVQQVGTSQANVSNHLRCLRECGLVAARPDGRQTFYRITTDEIVTLLGAAEGLLAQTGNAIELCKRYR